VALELTEASHQVTLSSRSPLAFARPPWLQMLSFPFYFAFENWIVKRKPFWLEDSRPAMDGGKAEKWIKQGLLQVRPEIKKIHPESVEFNDSQKEPFDLIIYATSFRPALEHLALLRLELSPQGLPPTRCFESTQYPDLFFLGLDGLRTFRSRYLRGIREDAAYLAQILKQRLA
jgi:putative flavoprotein involved in K+ transport